MTPSNAWISHAAGAASRSSDACDSSIVVYGSVLLLLRNAGAASRSMDGGIVPSHGLQVTHESDLRRRNAGAASRSTDCENIVQ